MSTNSTCHMKEAAQSPPPLVQNGKVVIQAHHIGWAVSGIFALAATIVSVWLINKHLQWYTNKREQRYIVRILFMVPIYSLVSFGSYLFWNQSTPLLLIRDCYESTVLTSFFYLLLMYLSPNPVEQKDIFRKVGLSKDNDRMALRRGEPVKNWMFPLGFLKSKPSDGLYFLQIMKWGVLQYCVVRPFTTLTAVVLDYAGLYCESSWSPGWGYVYITVIVSISVSVAMYCLIQIYVPISFHLAPHRPLLKLFSVKAVVFLTFWQATFLSLLATFGLVKDTQYMTAEDINIGIGAILETVEMTIFAFLHIKAFSYKPYCPEGSEISKGHSPSLERTPRLRSLKHALDFRETLREVWKGCVYIMLRFRGQETDRGARRLAAREEVFGGREPGKGKGADTQHPGAFDGHQIERSGLDPELQGLKIAVDVKQEVHVDEELQWLGTGDDYIYGLGFARRERSAGLGEQIEVELERRGLPHILRKESRARTKGRRQRDGTGLLHPDDARESEHQKQRSWWRNVYDRISGTGHDDRDDFGPRYDTNPGVFRKSSRRQPFNTKFTSVRGVVESDDYTRIPVAESYDEFSPTSRRLEFGRSKLPAHQVLGAAQAYIAPQMPFGSPTPSDAGLVDYSEECLPKRSPSAGRNEEERQNLSQQWKRDLSPLPDHVLSRLFTNSPTKSDAGMSSTRSITLSTNPSSQTHLHSDQRYLRLVPPAHIVPKGSVALRTPLVVHGDSRTRRPEDVGPRMESSGSAPVEGVNSETTPLSDCDLSSCREEKHITRDTHSKSIPPHRSFVDSNSHSPSNRLPASPPRESRSSQPKIVIPAPLAHGLAIEGNAQSQRHATTREEEIDQCTSFVPEIRISPAFSVRRKAVPQYQTQSFQTTPRDTRFGSKMVMNSTEVEHDPSSLAPYAPESEALPYAADDAIVSKLVITHLQSSGIPSEQGAREHEPQILATALKDTPSISETPVVQVIGESITPSKLSASLRSSPRKIYSNDSASNDSALDARLQRRGARSVRRSSAPLTRKSPDTSRASPQAAPLGGIQRSRYSKYHSSNFTNFSRHNLEGYPIAEESFQTGALCSVRRMSFPTISSILRDDRAPDLC